MERKRVKAKRGSAGVDGRTIAETATYLKTHWLRFREALLDGSYRPAPVGRVQISKSDGGVRELGIPTVTDRLIQPALLQVLQADYGQSSPKPRAHRPCPAVSNHHRAVDQQMDPCLMSQDWLPDTELAKALKSIAHLPGVRPTDKDQVVMISASAKSR